MTRKTVNRRAAESERVCKHCGSKLSAAQLVNIHGAAYEFCCGGCEAAWDMIHNLGLEDFYTRKAGIVTSRIGNQYIIEEHFADCVTHSETDGVKTDTAVFYVTSVRCAACVWLIENVVKRIDGVRDIRINYATYRTKVIYNPEKVTLKHILEQIAAVGNPPVPQNPVSDDSEKKDLFLRFGVGAFFTLQLMLYTFALYAGYFNDMPDGLKRVLQLISWGLATPVMFYTGAPFIRNSIKSLKQRHMSMDVLVALGSASAYFYSIAAIFLGYEVYFDTCATILTLITLGRFIEVSSKQKAKGNMLSLFALTPPFARLLDDAGNASLVMLGNVKAGDTLQILPGDKVPVDGLVLSGFSSVDESMLTGEPVPKSKEAGSKVYAGTMNTSGQLTVAAEAVTKGTVLSMIIDSIESADVSKTRLMQLVDKVVAVFVPSVILIAVLTFVIRVLFVDHAIAAALMHSVAVLVVACPCALGLAVPLAVTAATGNAASFGAVIKNGDLLGALRGIDTICFDKTGTLTEGAPEIVEYVEFDNRFLQYSASLEAYSTHTLAKTIVHGYDGERLTVNDVEERAGHGITGYIGGVRVSVGRLSFVSEYISGGIEGAVQNKGHTTVVVAIDGALTGYYLLSDPLRTDSIESIANLRKKYGIALLSGDSAAVVSEVAAELGIEPMAELTPFDKVEIIRDFQAEGRRVLMVGDGINDAPALKQADASVAVGQNATDVAIDSADAVLIRQDLSILEKLLILSIRSGRVIRENLVWSFLYNVIAIPLAVVGILHPIVSAICMSVSSVIVTLNSARLSK